MKILQILCIGIFYLFVFVSPSFAAPNPLCVQDDPRVECKFGTIIPPSPIATFTGGDPTGAGAISQFLSNFIVLLFSIAIIVLVFMLVWAALEWLTSGGDKEKIEAARKRILNAIIGIILFAVAFAIIRILGVFTGFTFFKENIKVLRDSQGVIYKVICSDGFPIGGPGANYNTKDLKAVCQGH